MPSPIQSIPLFLHFSPNLENFFSFPNFHGNIKFVRSTLVAAENVSSRSLIENGGRSEKTDTPRRKSVNSHCISFHCLLLKDDRQNVASQHLDTGISQAEFNH